MNYLPRDRGLKKMKPPPSCLIFIVICAMVKSRYIGDGRPPTFNRNPYNGYINPYYCVEFPSPITTGNNGTLDPGTCEFPPCLLEDYKKSTEKRSHLF